MLRIESCGVKILLSDTLERQGGKPTYIGDCMERHAININLFVKRKKQKSKPR